MANVVLCDAELNTFFIHGL